MKSEILVKAQSICDVETMETIYDEVLVREYNGIQGADNILRYVKSSGCCFEFDNDIMVDTLRKINEAEFNGETVAFNICSGTLTVDGRVDKLIRTIKENRGRYNVALEITEGTKFYNKTVLESIAKIKEAGIKLILDDFGKNRANIDSLRKFKFDIVKLDMEFMKDIQEDDRLFKITIGTVHLLKSLDTKVVVEGIETAQQLDIARIMGADYAQGYFLGEPRIVTSIGHESTEQITMASCW